MTSKTQHDDDFEVQYECDNCGARWVDTYPSGHSVEKNRRGLGKPVRAFDTSCSELGTLSCDCCTVIVCPVCEMDGAVQVAGRKPLDPAYRTNETDDAT